MNRPKMQRTDWAWFWMVATCWTLLIGAAGLPPSLWLSVGGVHVGDTVVGVAPPMSVDRAIRRDFQGDWIVTVMKKGSRGFSAFCTAEGSNDYRTDAELPDSIDLDWWTWPTQCVLPPGAYRVKTLWIIHLPLLPDKEVRSTSNVFSVR